MAGHLHDRPQVAHSDVSALRDMRQPAGEQEEAGGLADAEESDLSLTGG